MPWIKSLTKHYYHDSEKGCQEVWKAFSKLRHAHFRSRWRQL
jgi:hypothetical protein